MFKKRKIIKKGSDKIIHIQLDKDNKAGGKRDNIKTEGNHKKAKGEEKFEKQKQ